MQTLEQVRKLAAILVDSTATLTEKDDAAINLGEFDESEALTALIVAAQSEKVEEMVLASIGESIAQIWIRLDNFDSMIFNQLPRGAQREAHSLIQANRSEWLLNEKRSKITVRLAHTRNQKNLVAQLWCENEQWGEISHKQGELELDIYPKSNGHPWNLKYEEVVNVITEVKDKLPELANYSPRAYYEHRVTAA
ncbi:MAG: hypothetical protein DRR16_08595 [Candidatus Parabeggiatoa sp. nov. 3]|jgi:hypothetical protein|nr:MAG: hypothetical protein DRR00_15270 [Gammaproteobacteria bacterium]RKZ62452.1 MAG: hypothetical protein DRQ99_18705 [Gammaproteobacteria bacterium]RKZ86888.1 MAG: hypothetical protein DRR16_08595 [Gammaproteobacteria bacterium]